MYELSILSEGKFRNPHFQQLEQNYLNRISSVKINFLTAIPGDKRRDLLATYQKMIKAQSAPRYCCLLDERGKTKNSSDFSHWLKARLTSTQNHQGICFVLGGAYGIPKLIQEQADDQLSISQMTLPHQMARLFLIEQIYRATAIWYNHPYHHE